MFDRSDCQHSRSLSTDELDAVVGGGIVDAIIGAVISHVVEEVAPAFKVVDQIKGMITEKGK